MSTLLHTADWQMGLKASHVASVADRVRSARLEAARGLIAKANAAHVSAVVIAGDLFEDNLVQDGLVLEVVHVLSKATAPVYVLPGNHDPLSQDSVYRRASWKDRPRHVMLLETTDPVAVPGAELVLLPAPLHERKGFTDPTLSLSMAPSSTGRAVLVGVAHGSLRIEGKFATDDFPIALDAAVRAGVDYLALGHWHGQYIHKPRTAYPGAHETTSFGESNSGCALLVEITEHGAAPRFERVNSGKLVWRTRELDAGEGLVGLRAIRAELGQLERPLDTLVRVRVTGICDDDLAAALPGFEDDLAAKLLYVRLERADVPAATAQGRLDEIAHESPLVAALLEDLEAKMAVAGADTQSVVAARHLLGTIALEVWQ